MSKNISQYFDPSYLDSVILIKGEKSIKTTTKFFGFLSSKKPNKNPNQDLKEPEIQKQKCLNKINEKIDILKKDKRFTDPGSTNTGKTGKIEAFIKKQIRSNTSSNTCTYITEQQQKKCWRKCENDCFQICQKLVNIEINSTAYYLRTLSQSMMSSNKNNRTQYKIKFIYTQDLTGLWVNDKQNIIIQKIQTNNNKKPFLIMGFGPSAAGKTFWVQNILSLISSNYSTIKDKITTYVMSIDGGLFREHSVTYQFIKNIAKSGQNNAGITSLVRGMGSMIFDSSVVKNNIQIYLEEQKDNIYFSIYVPETLGFCFSTSTKILDTTVSCDKKYNKYFKILDNDQWLGLLIYQHLNNPDNKSTSCPFVKTDYNDYSMYKCVGCYPSGSSREIDEGKKYSPSAYKFTLEEGFDEMLKAPMGRFMIHNSGSRDRKSIITEFGPHRSKGMSHIFSDKPDNFIINVVPNEQDYNTTKKNKLTKQNELEKSYNCKYEYVRRNDFPNRLNSNTVHAFTDRKPSIYNVQYNSQNEARL